LSCLFPTERIHALASCDSTNDEAFSLLETVSDGIVWTLDQRQGRGSRGRGWTSPAGAHLAMTLALTGDGAIRPGAICYPILAGVAVYDALVEDMGEKRLQLKWPNDVLLEGRKLAGILCESRWSRDRVVIAIGIGINLRPHRAIEDLPKGFASLAELASPPAPGTIVTRMSRLLPERLESLSEPAALNSAWLERSFLVPGARLRIRAEGRVIEGSFTGLGATGTLCLRTTAGMLEQISQTCEDFQIVSGNAALE